MTFLPIVVRELRVASRKRRTIWLRVAAAVVSLVIGSGFLAVSTMSNGGGGGMPAAQLGGVLFHTLTWLALITALVAGLFFTADCLSEEKREGTLGFLFLTDLRGYDVTGGKLLATSLRAFCALLAVFPVLAITLTMGGVTGAYFWKTNLALLNALFCSLTAGIFVSSISRDSQKALGGTFSALFLWLAAGPALDIILTFSHRGGSGPFYSLTSPYYVYTMAGAWGRSPYWWGILVTQGIAWTLFAAASFLVKRVWREKRSRARAATSSISYAWHYGGRGRREAVRRKLLAINPVTWLACRERWQSFGVWLVALILLSLTVVLYAVEVSEVVPIALGLGGGFCSWLLYLWAASQSNRFFIEARRSGLIELLLGTPLAVRDIIWGQWRAWGRMFGAPILIIVGILFFSMFVGKGMMGGGSRMYGAEASWLMVIVVAVLRTAGVVGNIVALLWVGMWMGLTSKNFSIATIKALLIVQVVPGFLLGFTSVFMAMPMQAMSEDMMTVMAITSMLPIAKDVGFIVWARRQLYSSFRERASRGLAMAPVMAPPRIQMPPHVPPPMIPAGS